MLTEHAYPFLKRIAVHRVSSQNGAATLAPTKLVQEAVLGMMQSPTKLRPSRTLFRPDVLGDVRLCGG